MDGCEKRGEGGGGGTKAARSARAHTPLCGASHPAAVCFLHAVWRVETQVARSGHTSFQAGRKDMAENKGERGGGTVRADHSIRRPPSCAHPDPPRTCRRRSSALTGRTASTCQRVWSDCSSASIHSVRSQLLPRRHLGRLAAEPRAGWKGAAQVKVMAALVGVSSHLPAAAGGGTSVTSRRMADLSVCLRLSVFSPLVSGST
jgi:hypothetical protein